MDARLFFQTAPLIISMFGISVCTVFTIFYAVKQEYILLFPLISLYINHFFILFGNRMEAPKLYTPFVYSIVSYVTKYMS